MATILRRGSLLTQRSPLRTAFYFSSSIRHSLTSAPSHGSFVSPELNGFERRYSENAAAKELYNRQRQLLALNHKVPDVAVDAWVAPNAVLIGDVVVEDRSVVWHNTVLRGDLNHIRVGAYSAIGSKTVVHAAETSPTELSAETVIGKYTIIGSQCTLRSCIVEDEVRIGHRCVLMEGSMVEKHAILGDGSVLPPGRRIPGGQVWAGNPVRYVRDVTNDEKLDFTKLAESAYREAWEYSEEFLPYGTAYLEAEKLKKSLATPSP